MAHDPTTPPPPYGRMVFHAVLAAAVFFSINRFALEQPIETSLLWAFVAAPFAAILAYSQASRGS